MKNLSKKGKLIALAGALVLVCVASAVTMVTTGVLSSQSKGEYACLNENCKCHDGGFSCKFRFGKHCDECRGEKIISNLN